MDANRLTQVAILLADAIKELGEVSSGRLYAQVMGHISLYEYGTVIESLKRAKLITEKYHYLTWTGPK